MPTEPNGKNRKSWSKLFNWGKNIGALGAIIFGAITYGGDKANHKRDHGDIAVCDSAQNHILQQLASIQIRQDSVFTEFRIRFQLAFPHLEERIERRLRIRADSLNGLDSLPPP